MRALSERDIDFLEQMLIARARDDFWCFRALMNPTMKVGWFQKRVAAILQRFYNRLIAGERPMEVIQAPPQHGKSIQAVDFIAWLAGKHPDYKTIYASFSDRLGVRANAQMQRLLDKPKYKLIFPDTKMIDPGRTGTGYQRNRDQIDYVSKGGMFRNTTIRGPITGESLDLGILDDPHKGRADSNSLSMRDSAWDWLTDDFFTRFSENAGMLSILTRWHADDVIGRLSESNPKVRIHSFPALAIRDELHRKKGEPLFPEHKSLEFLLQRKAVLSENSWESLYQQSPFIRSGGLFPIDRLRFSDIKPHRNYIAASVRYWDKAGTKEGEGARTAGVLMHRMKDGSFVVEDIVFGRWAAREREERIKTTAQLDGARVEIRVEQEPGSGGKESAEATVANLAGFVIKADRPTGDKEIRAEPFAAQVQGGNVWLVRGPWNREYVTELEQFPNGPTKDMVDASSGAFNGISNVGYDLEALIAA